VSARAAILLAAQALANLALWVPLPLGVLWVASQLEYRTGSLLLGVTGGFALLLAAVRAGMLLVRRIDAAWLAHSTCHWRDDALGYIATSCAVVGGGGFALWLMVIGGLRSSIFPAN
jgi:hypothetical protein